MDPVCRAQLHSCSPTCCINLHRFFPNWPMPVWWPLNKSAPQFTRFLFGISVFDQNYFPLGGWASTRIGWNIARLAKRSDNTIWNSLFGHRRFLHFGHGHCLQQKGRFWPKELIECNIATLKITLILSKLHLAMQVDQSHQWTLNARTWKELQHWPA